MKPKNRIQVFEHERIRYGETYNGVRFTEAHFDALVAYNEQHDNRFFTPIHRGIQFSQYVGVIQVGRLTIEVLPKADREPVNPESKIRWQKVLLDMLKVCRLIRLEGSSEAELHLQNTTLLDLYIHLFLEEVEQLIHQGLIKKYRREDGNRGALTGSIQFQQHIARNLVHKERFYVRHQVYDTAHLLHQVLYEALRIIPLITANPNLADQVGRLRLSFPELPGMPISANTFDAVSYDRKTEHYRKAIDLARLLLLNFSPAIRSGAHPVLAILFDMNELFEEYVYRQLRQVPGLTVRRQVSKYFWENKKIRPDIVVEIGGETIVLDTKWKILREARPSDADLKQMYAYHHYFEADKTFLVYPWIPGLAPLSGSFRKESFECGVVFVQVVTQDGRLNSKIGEEITAHIF